MNSNYGKGAFDFDLGIGSNKPRSLNDQKNNKTPQYSYNSQQPKPSWQPNKPSWTHQPAPGQPGLATGSLNGPTSMVGDIFGKTWNSGSASGSSGLGIGTVEKNPNLFDDLVSSALGGGKGGNNGNVPLKNAAPVNSGASGIGNKSAYSMENLASSLPKTGNSGGAGGYSSGYSSGGIGGSGFNAGVSAIGGNKSGGTNLGGPSMKSMGGGIGGGMNANKDPFSNLANFGSKSQPGGLNSANKGSAKVDKVDHAFGDFQNATKPSVTTFPTGGVSASNSMPSPAFDTKMGDFGMPSAQSQTPVQSSGVDQFDVLFSSTGSGGSGASASGGFGSQESAMVDDWGFGGGNDGGMTTELEGLPPPPAGVSAASAKSKGTDNYKQGQYPDAIKWLSWAVILLEKAGEHDSLKEVLACRASCYKEVGEYKKAVADCTKVLEHDDANVAVLVQRALLYESMEKYRLGAEDLRTVLKIDPGNRVARSTIHRLTKMAD